MVIKLVTSLQLNRYINQAISLPMHALLDSDDVRTVTDALKQLIENAC